MLVSVFTLNCWGILGISRDRKVRMQAIAEEISSGKYDLVLLQEVWVKKDFESIRVVASSVLPYSLYFHSGVIGSGLCVLSKFKIIDSFYHQWVVNGYFHKIHHGDWFGGKGVGYCKVVTNEGIKINVYTAHLHAEYDTNHDEYLAHRFLQAFDTSQLIRHTRHSGDITILGGDLNTEPGSGAYRMLIHNTNLNDAFVSKHGTRPDYLGCTNETLENSYTPRQLRRQNHPGKRIDYIMFSSSNAYNMSTLECKNPLPSCVPGQGFSYSDHEAVSTTFEISLSMTDESRVVNLAERSRVLHDGLKVCQKALEKLEYRGSAYFICFLASTVLSIFLFIFVTMPMFISSICHSLLWLVSLFFLYMATVWNMMERNGILSGFDGLEVNIRSLEET
ncbi:putative neutral sphingomyelinase isoform X2 [Artemia franciscana]|uniref:sphingomyelin phosphodiesterase n=1 Tax=Artemia franciscana TaxID=6661 RepID=A0AA88I8H2_ARTSF|nr:hypothetical protein QYM36_004204 [Artemia franciscana]